MFMILFGGSSLYPNQTMSYYCNNKEFMHCKIEKSQHKDGFKVCEVIALQLASVVYTWWNGYKRNNKTEKAQCGQVGFTLSTKI